MCRDELTNADVCVVFNQTDALVSGSALFFWATGIGEQVLGDRFWATRLDTAIGVKDDHLAAMIARREQALTLFQAIGAPIAKPMHWRRQRAQLR